MLYDKYQQKIAVLAKIWKFIKRFRVVIISVVAAIFATTATCLALKGVVYESVPCPKTVVFGEELKYEAGAVFGDVRYQYAPAGTNDWSYEIPSRAGDYKVRAISKRAFGGKGYGKAQPFKIAPRPVEVWVSDTAILYGEDPRVDGEFLGDDYAACTAFAYGDLSKTATTVTPVAENVTVYDANGNDVTYCYDVRVKTTDIRFASREIIVTTADSAFTYDGTGHFDEGFVLTGDGLDAGETARVVSHTEAVDAGEHENELTVEIVGADGETVVTENYKITYEYGTLTVAKRKVHILSGGAEKVYDGESLSYTHYTIDGETPLLEGHTAKRSAATVVTDVCEVDNLLEFTFADGEGKDVTANYEVELTTGKLKIAKRPITLTTATATSVYDGKPFVCHTYELSVDGLVDGQKETVVFTGTQTVVGQATNEATMTVSTADGGDSTGNYEIDYVYGTLDVTVRKMTVKTNAHTWEYDGKAHADEGFVVVGETDFAEHQTAKVVGAPEITDFGEKSNEFTLTVFAGEENVTSNYEITYEHGTLAVEKRKVTVGLKDESFVYDGAAHKLTEPTFVENTLAEGQSVSVETSGEQTKVGSTDTVITAYEIYAGEEKVTDNYEITLQKGTVTIVQRAVRVQTETGSRVYNDEAYFLETYKVVDADGITRFDFVDGQTVRVTAHTEITEVKESGAENALTLKVYFGEEDVSDNYAIDYVLGTLTVTPRPLTITTKNAEKIYDGTALYSIGAETGYVLSDDGLVEGHFFKIDAYSSITEVKESGAKNTYTAYRITYETGEEIDLGNYAITENFEGVLTVLKRTVDFQTGDAEKVYDGTPLTEKSWRYYGDTLELVDGHSLHLVYTGSQTSAIVGENTSANTVDEGASRVYDNNGEDKTDNYELISWYGLLTVHRRQLTYTTASAVWMYNDEDYFNNSFVITDDPDDPDDGLAPSQVFTVLESTVMHNATDYEFDNTFTVDILDWEGQSTLGNYLLTEVCGKLKVNPRTLTITTQDAEKTYDGKPLYAIEENAGYELSGDGLATGHFLFITEYSKLTNVRDSGRYNHYSAWVITNAEGTEILLSNYAITVHNDGVLTVNPRKLTIVSASETRVYDGKEWSNTEFELQEEGLAEGERLEIYEHATIKTVGETANEFTVYAIVGNGGFVYKDNYDITEIWGTLKVTPRPITVTAGSAEKEYDDTELTSSEYAYTLYGVDIGLAENQTIEATTSGSQLYKGTSANVIASVVIKDENGEDVTGNYEITLVEGTLTVTPREIIITVTDKEKVYDGTALTSNAFTVDRLIQTHILTVDTDGSQTDVGESKNNVYGWKITKPFGGGEIDVTESYNPTFVAGTLKVTPRHVTIATGSGTWVYDDEYHYNWDYEIVEGSFVDGQTFVVLDSTGKREVCSDVDNVFALYAIRDGEGVDRTANYIVTQNYGKLEITARKIVFRSETASFEYDGTAHIALELEAVGGTSLVDGHLAIGEESSATVQTNVGIVQNILVARIWVQEGYQKRIVTENYEISYVYGTLEITARKIVVTADSGKRVYDGTALTVKTVTADRLVDGQLITAQTVGAVTDVGTAINEIVAGTVVIEYNGEDVTANYEIVGYETGTLEVFKRAILVKTYGGSRYYDGTAFYKERYEAIEVDNENFFDFLASEEVVVLSHTEITLVRESGTENILVLDILRDGVSNLSNYDLQYIYGTLHIQPRPITITSASAEKVYDGTPLLDGSYQTVCPIDAEKVLGVGDELTVQITGSQTVVGTSENSFEWSIESLTRGEDASGNYFVTPVFGTLQVTPRELTLTTEDCSWVYDGEAHQHAVYTIGGMGVAQTDEEVLTFIAEIERYGERPNELYLAFVTADGEDRTDCYEFTAIDYGTLKIERRTVLVKSYGGSWEYDGTPHTETGYGVVYKADLASYAFVEGELVEVTATEITEVKKSGKNNELQFSVYDGEEDVTFCYDIQQILSGTLEITPRKTSVIADSGKRVYDGTPFTVTTVTADRLVEGQAVTAQTTGEIVDFGTAENAVVEGTVVFTANGVDVTDNYEITDYGKGTLEILKRTVIVGTASRSWVYDGEPHHDEGYEVLGVDNVNFFDFVDGEYVYVSSHTEITNVWESGDNVLILDILREGEANLHNYELIYDYGTLEITPRPIIVTAGSMSKTYDGSTLKYDYYVYTPYAKDKGLLEGHEFSATVEGSQTNAGISANEVVEDSIVIKANGVDVTENYAITRELGVLTVTPIEIEYSTGSAVKKFDGTPLKNNDVTIHSGEAAPGETLVFTTESEQLFAGETLNKVTLTVTYADGTQAPVENYKLVPIVFGTLRVTPIVLKIETGSAEKTYDGTPLTYDSYTWISGELLDGHTLEVRMTGEQTLIGTSNNTAKIYVTDRDGEDMSDGYEVQWVYGKLTVVANEETVDRITIRPVTVERMYNGAPLYPEQKVEDVSGEDGLYQLLERGYRYVVTVVGSQTEIGVGESTISKFTLYKPDGTPVGADEVEVTFEKGELIVRDPYDFDFDTIVIKPVDVSKVYDGTPLFPVNEIEIDGTLQTLLNLGYTYDNVVVEGVRTDIGVGFSEIVSFRLLDPNGIPVSEDEIEVVYMYGELRVTGLMIRVHLNDIVVEYDGQEHAYAEDDYWVEMPEGYEDYILNFTLSGARTEVGCVEREEIERLPYTVTAPDGTDVTDLFSLVFKGETLTVVSRKIKLSVYDAEKVYDGTPLEGEVLLTFGSLVDGHILDYTAECSITNAGRLKCALLNLSISDINGRDVTRNYDVTLELGVLTVHQREIVYSTGSAEKVYDGTPLTNSDVTIHSGEAAPNEQITLEAVGTITDVGQVYNEVKLTATYADGTETPAENYKLIVEELGTLTVTLRPITIRSEGAEKVYDGTPLTNPTASLAEGSLADGQILDCFGIGTITNAGSILNAIEYTITTADGEDVTKNYEVDPELGILTVHQREIVYSTGSGIKQFDGTPLTNSDVTIHSGEAAPNEQIALEAIGSITFAGSTPNEVQLTATYADGTEAPAQNYFLVAKSLGTLRVTPIVLKIETGSATKVYDGEPLTEDSYTWISGELLDGHTLEVSVTGQQTFIGTSENTASIRVTDEAQNDWTGGYYAQWLLGKLTVLRDPELPETITIRPVTVSKEYDGTPLYPIQEVEDVEAFGLQTLLEKNYRYEVTIVGSRTERGVGESTITSFTLYDPNGLPVGEDKVVVVWETGRLRVTGLQIIINLYEVIEEYDGEEHAYFEDDYWAEMPAGFEDYTLDFILVGTRTEAGRLDLAYLEELPFTVVAPDGTDATDLFSLVFEGEPLTVEPREITLSVLDARKVYDGKPLEGKAVVTFGELLDGHTIVYTTSDSITDVGHVTCSIWLVQIYDENGNDVTRNYNITKIEGTLTVVGG